MATKAARGGLTIDGRWDDRANPEGEYLDLLTQRIDSLCQTRRRTDKRYSPREFALQIAARHGDLVKQPADETRCVFNDYTMAEWMKLDAFEHWPTAPTRTIAERAVRDAGYGPHVRWVGGRALPRRQMIVEPPVTGDQAKELAAEFRAVLSKAVRR